MNIVYAIYNKKHDKIYIDQTTDINERLALHNNRIFKAGYTAKFDGEWRIIYQEKVSDRRTALLREKQLKSFRGRELVKQFIPR